MMKLRNGTPSIEVMGGKDNSITITSWNMQDGEDKIVAKRLFEEMTQASVLG